MHRQWISACLRLGETELWLPMGRGIFLVQWNGLKWIVQMVAQLCEYTKIHWVVHFKWRTVWCVHDISVQLFHMRKGGGNKRGKQSSPLFHIRVPLSLKIGVFCRKSFGIQDSPSANSLVIFFFSISSLVFITRLINTWETAFTTSWSISKQNTAYTLALQS